MQIDIKPLLPTEVAAYDEHFARHRAESGRGDYHFMPFTPGDPEGPRGLDPNMLEAKLLDLSKQGILMGCDQGGPLLDGVLQQLPIHLCRHDKHQSVGLLGVEELYGQLKRGVEH